MLKKLLITGAAGGIGRHLRGKLGHVAETLRLSDIAAVDDPEPGAEVVPCDLADPAAVDALVAGCDGILHLGGISNEQAWARILPANIIGVHNLYEAARAHGHPRIFFASSNHVIGFYPQGERLNEQTPHRPDTWYGVSKSFGEAAALMYFHKFGQESALVRIGSCTQVPRDHRMLKTWMALSDFESLVERVFAAERLGCPVIYGVSDNDGSWWDNSAVADLGWAPRENAARFAETMARDVPRPGPEDAMEKWQGGAYAALPITK